MLAAHRRTEDEVLAMDVVLRGAPNAAKHIISSGTHGSEGFCSSGSQVGLLHGSELLDRLTKAWSSQTVRKTLRQQASWTTNIAWINIHTGLGRYGHGEKIFAGRNQSSEIARTRAWRGPTYSVFSLASRSPWEYEARL